MSRIAVAGAGGFVGSHVAARLRASGHDVVAIDRAGADLSSARAAGASIVHADLGDPVAARAALSGAERVVNATGLFDLGASEAALDAANVDVTRAIVRAAREVRVERVVHVSSTAVYGTPARVPMPEDGAQRPRDPYQRSKQRGERAAIEAAGAMELAVLRPTLVYGPRARYGLAMMIALVAEARALGLSRLPLVPGGPRTHHVHVEDVARAVELLLFTDRAAGRAFNAVDAAPIAGGDLLVAIARALDVRVLPRALAPGWRLLSRLAPRVPERAMSLANARIRRGHEALARRGRAGVLVPRLDRDWLGYFARDHVYEGAALAGLGFRPVHPDLRHALPRVVDDYRERGWLATSPNERAKAH